jgi:predicted dehydrogenase
MAGQSINVCLIGQKFMGRAHSNAYLKAGKFFDLPAELVMDTIVARNRAELDVFAKRWGWKNASIDWREAIKNPLINLVDVTTPNNKHREIVIAALEAGKHVACEKPLAATLEDARIMRDAAKKAKKSKTFVWYSYRRVPAVALAHRLVKEGRIGKIYHVRAYYLQDWAGPNVPLVWRFSKEQAGSGSHGDLGAHIIDMARFITGEEITEVIGAAQDTFIKERTLVTEESKGGISGGATAGSGKKGKVSVDDHTTFLARMSGGAIATFEATRFATGYHNKNGLEIHGEKGALRFNFEDMPYLDFFDRSVDSKLAGWTRIPASRAPEHPYASAWWPTAHHQGYEHTFINMAADICRVLGGEQPEVPIPDFEDAYKTQEVLEAATISATERRGVKISELRRG